MRYRRVLKLVAKITCLCLVAHPLLSDVNPDTDPPTIVHKPIESTSPESPLVIRAMIFDKESTLCHVRVYFRRRSEDSYVHKPMNLSDDIYEAKIPASYLSEPGLDYYIIATDSVGNVASFPKRSPRTRPILVEVRMSPLGDEEIIDAATTGTSAELEQTASEQIKSIYAELIIPIDLLEDLSDIKPDSIKILVDGEDVTSSADLNEGRLTYIPPNKFAPGEHTITILMKEAGGVEAPREVKTYVVPLQEREITIDIAKLGTTFGAGESPDAEGEQDRDGELRLPLIINAGLDLTSKYIWRGYNLADRFSIQPFADIQFGNIPLSLNIWASAALEERSLFESADELDLTLSYSPQLNRWLGFSLGFIYYIFPTQEDFTFADHTTEEIFVGLSFQEIPLNPSITVYGDFDLGDDFYAEFSVEQDITIDRNPVTLRTAVGYNGGQFGSDPGISHVDISLSTQTSIGPIEITPKVIYTISAESTVNPDNEIYLMIGLQR